MNEYDIRLQHIIPALKFHHTEYSIDSKIALIRRFLYTLSIQEDDLFRKLCQSISCGQIDSIVKEDVQIFADCELITLCLSF